MEDISIYFQPVAETQIPLRGLAHTIQTHRENNFPELKKGGVALFYVPEYRNTNYHADDNNEYFRVELSKLQADSNWQFPIYDLGTILPGATVSDTYTA
jgi:formiminoglutamase